jgi:hypothetical protein
MVEHRLIVKLLEIAYYEGDQMTTKTLATEGMKLMTSKVGLLGSFKCVRISEIS